MPDISSSSFSETDANCNSASPNGFPEGMAPSGVNDSARAVMGAIKRWYDHANAVKTTGGSANAHTLTYDVAPAAYVTGDGYAFKAGFTNTAAATLNVNALGDISIVTADGIALVGGEIIANSYYTVFYDGTNFRLMSARNISKDNPGNPVETTGGAADAQTLTYDVAPPAYVAGDRYTFKAGFTNTAAATLNINGLGAVTIGTNQGTTLRGGEIAQNSYYTAYYDGTIFRLGEVNDQDQSQPGFFSTVGGIYVQWGQVTITAANTAAVTFPQAFGSSATVLVSLNQAAGSSLTCSVSSITTTGFNFNLSAVSTVVGNWVALGF